MRHIGNKIEANITYNSGSTAVEYQIVRNGDIIFNGLVNYGNKIRLNSVLATDLKSADITDLSTGCTINTDLIHTYTFNNTGGTITLTDNDVMNWYPAYNTKTNQFTGISDGFINLAEYDNIGGNWGLTSEGLRTPAVVSDDYYITGSFLWLGNTYTDDITLWIQYDEDTWDKITIASSVTLNKYDNVIVTIPTSILSSYHFDKAQQLKIQFSNEAIFANVLQGINSCRVRYVVSWTGRNGAVYTLPMFGNDTPIENISKKEILDLWDTTNVYDTEVETQITINTGFISNDYIIRLLEDLFISDNVRIWDSVNDNIYIAKVTGNYQYKKFEDEMKLINYSVDFKIAHRENIRYR